MRPLPVLLAAALLAAPTLAVAGAHLHLPKAHHHHRGRDAEPAGEPVPKSDIPDPVFGGDHRAR